MVDLVKVVRWARLWLALMRMLQSDACTDSTRLGKIAVGVSLGLCDARSNRWRLVGNSLTREASSVFGCFVGVHMGAEDVLDKARTLCKYLGCSGSSAVGLVHASTVGGQLGAIVVGSTLAAWSQRRQSQWIDNWRRCHRSCQSVAAFIS